MAAGCTIQRQGFDDFASALAHIARDTLTEADLQQQLWHDGSLLADWLNLPTAELLRDQVWGQGFAEPVFCDAVRIQDQRIVGEKHLRLSVALHGQVLNAIYFGRTDPLPSRCQIAYALELNTWQGQTRLQLRVLAAEH